MFTERERGNQEVHVEPAPRAVPARRDCGAARSPGDEERTVPMIKVLLVLLCLVLPFLAVLLKDGPSLKVLWAFLLQLCGHIPGVIYGIYQVVKD
jgi:uncharacterized membrane protein YqaE (UPF0057 family)